MEDNSDKNLKLHLQSLLTNQILPKAWVGVSRASLYFADPDSFRRDRLYFEDVNRVCLAHADKLYKVFILYAQRSQKRLREFTQTTPQLCEDEWASLLRDSRVLPKSVTGAQKKSV